MSLQVGGGKAPTISRRVVTFGLVAMLLMIVGWYFALWKPRLNAIVTAQSRADSAESAQEFAEQNAAFLANQAIDSKVQAEVLERLKRGVPDAISLDTIFTTMADIAASSGVQVGTITPTEPTSKRKPTVVLGTGAAPVTEIPVNFDIKGTYAQIQNFLTKLEMVTLTGDKNTSRLFVLDDFAVNSETGGVLQVAISSRAFTSATPKAEK